MSPKKATKKPVKKPAGATSTGFTAEERAAMKEKNNAAKSEPASEPTGE